ncbi:MAG: primary-amine oxidase [Armatimonadetes bacterium]|nr:primary-amine oxidase [Armatimonadota bacterium]
MRQPARRPPSPGHRGGLLAYLCLLWLLFPAAASARQHPLDPLTREELETMVRVLKEAGKTREGSLFPIAVLHEPAKELVRAWKPGDPVVRQAFAVVLDREANRTFEAVVDVGAGRLVSWTEMPGAQPAVLIEEFESPTDFVRADPRFQAAMRKRGITDYENVQVDTWAAGLLTPEQQASGMRLLRCLPYYRAPGDRNPHGRPIEGVVALVDIANKKVLEVVDTGVAPVPPRVELGEEHQPALRPDRRPVVCQQPGAAGFTLDGHEVSWEKWRFRFGMHPREGLVLYDVRYEDEGQLRPILYRASLNEMLVPYGDNDSNWYWRNAFDLGEYGVGRLADTLEPGLDVPEYSTMVDAVFADDLGEAYVQKDVVALFEKEMGILWKHYDFETDSSETRRARWLHVKYVATVGNYDYAIDWIFGQDGSLSLEAELTGILLARGVSEEKVDGIQASGIQRFGRMVGKNIVTPNHQHFFNFRLDFDVDGTSNTLVETNNRALPQGPENPAHNAFSMEVSPLATEAEARRHLDLGTNRRWLVINPDRPNELGQPTAYMLVPGENSVPYLYPESPIRQRGRFVDYHVWGTRYRPDEMNAAGYYVNQAPGGEGLPRWSQGEALEKQDLVLWYTFGVTHNPRPEEWPVMPSHHTGFKLLPNGFFSRNPAMDVPSGVPDKQP